MTQEELNKVLERHLHWLRKDCAGWESMRANLKDTDLKFADLKCADLKFADLRSTDLRFANLECTDLESANLEWADLRCANLKLTNFRYANLKHTNLKCANLRFTTLEDANLACAKLEGIDLVETSFEGAKNLPFVPMSCPDTGSFIGWKNVSNKIIKLEIPADAKRCSSLSEKCRCNKAKVLEIQEIDGNISDITKIRSDYDISFIYEVGKTVSVKYFCEDRWRECSQGIHFFINRQSAVEY